MVYLARTKPQPILSGKQRDRIVSHIMDTLDDWRLSPFEYEADCRHVLRVALCLEGHRWPVADAEALAIVRDGLARNGASKPKWDEGQRDRTVSEDYCRYCFNPLSPIKLETGSRFCGLACATARFDKPNRWRDAGAKLAYQEIRKTQTTPRQCEQCGNTYQVHSESLPTRFCSRICGNASRRTREQIPCEYCATLFLPPSKNSKCCSLACSAAVRKTVSFVKSCAFCECSFVAKSPIAEVCGIRCYNRMTTRKKVAARPPIPAERVCCCGKTFKPKTLKNIHCSKACLNLAWRRDAKAKAVILQFPTIDPAVFDREFAMAA